MPYVPVAERESAEHIIDSFDPSTWSWGQINYFLIQFLRKTFSKPSYISFVYVMGTLVCVGLEFYRRICAPYEDKKKEENGDVF